MGPDMIENWPEILNQCIDDARRREFTWGRFDCCMWAADTVEAMTGTDYAAEFRGKYKTIRGAVKALNKRTLKEVMDGKFARTEHPSRGDLVLIPIEITGQPIEGIGICAGDKLVMIGDGGLEFLPLSVATAAWAVKHG